MTIVNIDDHHKIVMNQPTREMNNSKYIYSLANELYNHQVLDTRSTHRHVYLNT